MGECGPSFGWDEMAFSGKIDVENATPLAEEQWKFEIGKCVSHKSQSLPSLVLSHLRSSTGLEFYGVRSFAVDDTNRDRMIEGRALVSVTPGSEPCLGCLLYNTGMCPGDV